MPFTNPAAGAWPSTAAVRAGSAGAREGRDSCCRCQALSLRSQTAAHARWKMSSSATGKTPPPGFPQRTVPRPWRPETPDALPSPILRRLSRPRQAAPRLAARRCGKQLLLAGDVGMPPGCFRGLCSGRGGAQIAFEPPILTEGLRWRAFSQFDAYHHVLWTTATSVGQAGASPSQCARGLVTRHTPPSTAKRGRTAEGSPRLLQRYW
jgi:hypothetical protein